MVSMSARTADYLEVIEHLPEGSTLVILKTGWDDFERFMRTARKPPASWEYYCTRF